MGTVAPGKEVGGRGSRVSRVFRMYFEDPCVAVCEDKGSHGFSRCRIRPFPAFSDTLVFVFWTPLPL